MKTLFEACKPRQSVFDETKRDDTLDLSNLLDGSIDGKHFFEETFITEGMELLFDTAFKRFQGKAASGLIKLTQAMGGGKTHNMVALGVLAKNKEIRKSILNGKYAFMDSDIRVVAYTGRETHLKFGIWGEIAQQLGKKELFNSFYSPLMAPGQSAWINLLKSDIPTLILLDELPPYLQNARTIPVGTGTVADITTTALANLFNAVGKSELCNVCVVVSDLQATYEEGSQLLQRSFKELENEIERFAINIEPVGSNTDDLYNILRTRLFEKVGNKDDIDEIAAGYRKAVVEARQMGYTNYTPEEIVKGIYASYPFHPSIRDLFARFKENPGFQQTRGFIRLTRMMVKNLYSNDIKAKERYLINAYDMDLNDKELTPMVKSIKPKLSNAISHDIADQGRAVAELIDEQDQEYRYARFKQINSGIFFSQCN
jgi:predicted AAA+ superfamily ATPase